MAPPNAVGPGIRGSVIKSRLDHVAARAGAEGVERVLSRLSAEDQAVLRGWILPISWYAFELNQRLDNAIARELSPHDRSQVFLDMGRASAAANLQTTQRPFVRAGEPHFLLQSAPQIYAAYYKVGRREYEKTGPTSAVLRTHDAESVTATDCLTVVGWHVHAIELCGGKNVNVVETRGRARGDALCEYQCSWS